MYFTGPAARWLQSIEPKLPSCSWSSFCQLILDRFGKDHHELLIRQLFHIKQLTSVAEYIERFSRLVDQLAAYESKSDQLYYTTRFVDGLKSDIRSAVVIQRPPDLDTACALALLQEEVLDRNKSRDFPRADYSARSLARVPLPLPLPPSSDKSLPQSASDGIRAPDSSRSRFLDDKLSGLCAYHRAKGLCVKCAEKWSRDHKCPEAVQLHVIQELYDLIQFEEEQSEEDFSQPGSEHLFFSLSEAALTGVEAPKTMRFKGFIQNQEVLVLIDSGSCHTFISDTVAAQLSGLSPLPHSLNVLVANGNKMSCQSQLLGAQWSLQGCHFTSDMKVIPLSHYDIIVGMDWLETFSPMKVHWKQKWMSIPYQGTSVILQGLVPELPEHSVVEVCAVLFTYSAILDLNVPPELAALLHQYEDVFQPPSGLPPSRHCDNEIPLIEGASPVSVRPYRYPPAIKDEIERQIIQMLEEGIIQHSTTPFSSFVLLVKKKDKT